MSRKCFHDDTEGYMVGVRSNSPTSVVNCMTTNGAVSDVRMLGFDQYHTEVLHTTTCTVYWSTTGSTKLLYQVYSTVPAT
jgi:hypothetical protein